MFGGQGVWKLFIFVIAFHNDQAKQDDKLLHKKV